MNYKKRDVFDGRKMREIRISAGIRQEDISAKTGIAIETLSRYENGKVVPHKKNLEKLAKYLGVEVVAFTPDANSVSITEPLPKLKKYRKYKSRQAKHHE